MPGSEVGDGVGDGEGASGVVDVEVLDHATVDGDHASTVGLGLGEGVDDPAGVLDVSFARGPDFVGRIDLARMDERLAVEAELEALGRFGHEAISVLTLLYTPSRMILPASRAARMDVAR